VLIEKNRETKKVVIYKKIAFFIFGFHSTKSNSTVGFPQTPFVRSFFPISERRRKKRKKKEKKSEIGAKTGLKKKNLLLSFLCQMITCLFELSKVLSSASS
jgi:uncharacterized protein YqhQ